MPVIDIRCTPISARKRDALAREVFAAVQPILAKPAVDIVFHEGVVYANGEAAEPLDRLLVTVTVSTLPDGAMAEFGEAFTAAARNALEQPKLFTVIMFNVLGADSVLLNFPPA